MSYRDQVRLSPAQRAALFDSAAGILVAAGAGSGKTRLLVSYFVSSLLDDDVPLERLAAVTFTRKAGSELAGRIRAELVQRDRPDLARQVDGASIGTIHGLCRRLLADRALSAGVDPSFGVLESDAEKLVKEEVSREAWERVVREASEDELTVLAARGDRLRELMLSLYDSLRTMGCEAPRLHIDAGPSPGATREALREACQEALAAGRSVAKCGASLQKDLETIESCIEWLERTAAGPAGDRTVAVAGSFFPSRRTPTAEPFLAPVRTALAGYRCVLAEEELRPLVAVTDRLLSVFHESYSAYKETRGVLDFADLELRARSLLAPARTSPTARTATAGTVAAGTAAAGLFTRLLVDEFQDTNELQCAILEGLVPERLVMVGDDRQSIYRFRGADVEVFRKREESPALSRHRLDTNYRSRPAILTFINHLFAHDHFFGRQGFMRLVPGRAVAPATVPAGTTAPTEVLVVERTIGEGDEAVTLPAREVEAAVAAERIGRFVHEEGKAQHDIVLLLPALREVSLYQQALQARGIDVYVVRGKGYYSQDEVADVTALLRLLVNPHDDLALLTVLRSPMIGVTDDCLYVLGRARTQAARSLWEVMRVADIPGVHPADRERLAVFTGSLADLRQRAGRPGLSRLIDDAVGAFGYDLCLLASAEGRRRFANVRKLMRMAADFEALEGPDLAGFVSLIGSLGDLGDDEGNAASLAEGANVVRIMTVHQAKGLEFPVVVLAGLHRDSPGGKRGDIVVGGDGRMAALVRDVDFDKKAEVYPPHWGPAPEIIADDRRREAEEDVRLLYVAMTRAEDHLILVGARKAADKLEANPIGRIVAALGLDKAPRPGDTVALPDMEAAVIGVDAGLLADEGNGEACLGGALAGESSAAACPPSLLALQPPGPSPRQVSFSALSVYERCPRRFYLERVLGLGGAADADRAGAGHSPPGGNSLLDGDTHDPTAIVAGPAGRADALLDGVEEGASGRDVGILVHALLERMGAAAERPAAADLLEVGEALAAAGGLELTAEALGRAAALAAAYWDSPFAGSSEAAGGSREVPFSFVHDGLVVQGVLDLLCAGAQRWLIIDYKSNALAGRTPAAMAEDYRMQAAMYCLAALKAGAPAVRMELLFLEQPGHPVGFEYRHEDRESLEEQLTGALAGIVAGRTAPCPGPACSDCPVKDVCSAMNQG